MASLTAPQPTIAPAKTRKDWALPLLIVLLSYGTGVYLIFNLNMPFWQQALSALLGLPLFLILATFLGLITFAAFLPELDKKVGNRSDRTITNLADGYSVTFLETGPETNGAYELVEVNLGPKGGNGWHYHKNFVEQFTVNKGQLSIGLDGKELHLTDGQYAEAPINSVHKFYNITDKPVNFTVKVVPASGLEKTLRVGYGLANTGQSNKDGIPSNFWHLCLFLGYSGSYMANIPSIIQESLFPALAKIAQWKGEDKALETFFK